MTALRPSAKVGIIFLGLVVAAVIAWVAVDISQRMSHVPAAERAGAMYAFGDMLFGVAVFGVAALVPIGLALYWLRPVGKFWVILSRLAIVWALTGFIAIAINHWSMPPMGWWTLLGNVRFGLMPLTALALVAAALFAPLAHFRWTLAAAAACDGLAFVGVVVATAMTTN